MGDKLYYLIFGLAIFIMLGVWIGFPDADIWLKITADCGWFIVMLGMICKIFKS